MPTSDVVTTIPWSTPERLEYRLVDNGGKDLGTGTLAVERSSEGFTLSSSFQSETSKDDSTVVVDALTLKPISSRRQIVTKDDDETIEVQYTDQGAVIKQGDKQSGLSVPEHSYDNDSSLWLWRTIDLHEGFEASYTTIITNRRSRQTVNLRVTGKQSVTVPAGTFDAWRVEVRTSNARQIAWIADTPQRTLLKYDNDRNVIFELTSKP
ncbi:MAG TPA: DUF3108 domain-containing protein [Dehalococcoidia bacterium]|nr:DUF3108 domain-containing protein [Dehalococcoidia bacterium]